MFWVRVLSLRVTTSLVEWPIFYFFFPNEPNKPPLLLSLNRFSERLLRKLTETPIELLAETDPRNDGSNPDPNSQPWPFSASYILSGLTCLCLALHAPFEVTSQLKASNLIFERVSESNRIDSFTFGVLEN